MPAGSESGSLRAVRALDSDGAPRSARRVARGPGRAVLEHLQERGVDVKALTQQARPAHHYPRRWAMGPRCCFGVAWGDPGGRNRWCCGHNDNDNNYNYNYNNNNIWCCGSESLAIN